MNVLEGEVGIIYRCEWKGHEEMMDELERQENFEKRKGKKKAQDRMKMEQINVIWSNWVLDREDGERLFLKIKQRVNVWHEPILFHKHP